ncbi:MAG: ATP-dependent zinc metalloprotease FtsH, partial [Gammaproteobacteria bacterium]
SISGSDFVEMFVGVGASRVRDMFQTARKEAPALIFIDELDAVGRSRGAGLGGGHDEREQTLNQILTEMDGFEAHENILVLAATNRPDVLDSALLRPGRFDRKITLDRPHKDAREAILKVHVRKVPLANDVDLGVIAARTIGFSGADLKNLVNEAALTAVREDLDEVNTHCFDLARDRIILGEERDAHMTPEEREAVAYHECGHALMAYHMPKADPLTKVTIIPHGMAMGVTEQTPREDHYTYTESYLKDRIKVMLGGRSAEKLIYGEVSTGAQNDLKEATSLIRKMIGQWGMSEKIGPLGLSIGEENVFLGREMGLPREFSEKMAELIDAEIQSQLLALEKATLDFLSEHRNQLEVLAKEVLKQETLSAEQIEEILRKEQTRKIA